MIQQEKVCAEQYYCIFYSTVQQRYILSCCTFYRIISAVSADALNCFWIESYYDYKFYGMECFLVVSEEETYILISMNHEHEEIIICENGDWRINE